MEDDVGLGSKRHAATAAEGDSPDCADRGHLVVDAGGVAGDGIVAGQAEDDGDVGAVPVAGLGERAVEVDADAGDAVELSPRSRQAGEEPLGRPPRPHRVRTRRADADLEDVEGADRFHGRSRTRRTDAAA